jgi:hypothetical protein
MLKFLPRGDTSSVGQDEKKKEKKSPPEVTKQRTLLLPDVSGARHQDCVQTMRKARGKKSDIQGRYWPSSVPVEARSGLEWKLRMWNVFHQEKKRARGNACVCRDLPSERAKRFGGRVEVRNEENEIRSLTAHNG